MANIYIDSVGYTAVAPWVLATAYSSTANGGRGSYVRQATTPAVGSERVFRCTTSGTSMATEPTWTLTKNGTTTETGGLVWTECTGQEADQVAGTWKAPHARSANAFASTWSAAGDTFFLGDDHAETQASALNWTPPGTAASPSVVLCVDHLGSVPPVAADVKTSPLAKVTSTGANTLTIGLSSTFFKARGIEFSSGSGATSTGINIAGGNYAAAIILEDCKLTKPGTVASVLAMQIGGGGGGSSRLRLSLINTPMSFGAAGDSVGIYITDFYWYATPSAIVGTLPTTLFANTALGGKAWLEGVDLSALGSGKKLVASQTGGRDFYFKDCTLAAAVTIALTQVDQVAGAIYVLRSDSGATNYRNEKWMYAGTQVPETVIARTGGASDGATLLSANITTTANAKWLFPFEALPLVVFNGTTGATVTVDVRGVWNAAALPNNDEVWLDLEYLGASASPLGSIKSGTKANFLATGAAHTASTQAWDSLVTARANSTTYAVGNVRKVASNAGRIFFVTAQTGASASTEPAGFASAVDGGSVTDGGVTWRAGVRFKLTATLSSPQPQMAGYVYAYPKVGKASTTVYLDPKIVLI